MNPPAPEGEWYDRRPTAMGFSAYNNITDLGLGDFQGGEDGQGKYSGWVNIEARTGVVNVVFVPISTGVNAACIVSINIDALYDDPGEFSSTTGGGISGENFVVSLGADGVRISWENITKGVLVFGYGSGYVGRVLCGGSSDLAALRALPAIWGGDGEGTPAYLTIDSDQAYLTIETENLVPFNVYGFNLLDPSITPKVTGSVASSGVPCAVVGGDYGIEVTQPDIAHTRTLVIDSQQWLFVADI